MDLNTNEFSLLEVLLKLKNEFKQADEYIQLNLTSMSSFVVTGLTSTISNVNQVGVAFRDIFEKVFRYIPNDEEKLIAVDFGFQKNPNGNTSEYELCVYVMVKNNNDSCSIAMFEPSTVKCFNHLNTYSDKVYLYFMISIPFNYQIR